MQVETQEMQVRSLAQEDPLEEEMDPTPAFLPGESHGKEPGGLWYMGHRVRHD